MISTKRLVDAGCSKPFSLKAMEYNMLFKGHVEAFILDIEDILKVTRTANELDLEPDVPPIPANHLDEGNKRVEYDYTGDNLTYHGYDLEHDSKRY